LENIIFDNRGSIKIDDYVNIGPNCTLFTRGHSINSPLFETKTNPIYLGKYCVLFSNIIVLPSSVVGEKAVVYPGSVVSGYVNPASINNQGNRSSLMLYSPAYPDNSLD